MYEDNDLWAGLSLQRSARVENRNIWFYLVSSSIGNFAVVQWEEPSLEIHEKIFRDSYDKAESFFERTVSKIAMGKM